jgi:hypothetical protein
MLMLDTVGEPYGERHGVAVILSIGIGTDTLTLGNQDGIMVILGLMFGVISTDVKFYEF